MSDTGMTLKQLANLLADACGATSVAVWSCAFGELDLRHSHDIAQRHLGAAYRAWTCGRDDLQAGATVTERGLTFVPVFDGQHHLVGLLALPVPLPQREPTRAFLDEVLRLIARRVALPSPPDEPDLIVAPIESLVEPGGVTEWLHDVYERVMLRFGWNVSLVAGLVGVPRATLASRLASVGARRRTPSPKARQPHRRRTTKDTIDDAVIELLFPRAQDAPPPRPRRR